MCCQDPSVIYNIAKKHSAFRLKRYGVVRSIDKLNATGCFRKDDGLFAPMKNTPVSFEPVQVKKTGASDDSTSVVTMAHMRGAQGQVRSFLITKKNANKVAKNISKRKQGGRMAAAQALRAKKVVRSTTRALSLANKA
ncbi:hypothetical protein XU18_2218 [Perkinsela sp. CCAP 1560/4]|nr:hypothetical protein XU18_2218 [Perkinsela sp. CCAP 1560/4]|eukprot:KNH07041.1 hypothetical protein XU18_2218 [Perkinsela sp. CCAP 1560/4]